MAEKKMTLEEACRLWGLKQSEVNFITSEFEGKQWWRNNRTLELIEVADDPPSVPKHCYFCERGGKFVKTIFKLRRLVEVACPKCKRLIRKYGGRIVK